MNPHRIMPNGDTQRGAAESVEPRKSNSKQKKMACVECRQQKSKCDASDQYPNPCTRCVKKKIECSLQSDYKRTYKRAKFQQIEEELEELKKNLSQAGVDSLLKHLQERRYQPHELNSPTGSAGTTPQPTPGLIQSSQLPPLRSALGTTSPYQSPPLRPQFSHTQRSPVVHEPQSHFAPSHQHAPSQAQAQVQIQNHSQQLPQGPSIIRETTPTSPTANRPNLQTNAELIVDLSEEVLRCTPKQFGEVELSSAQIRELYVEFVNKYHRFLPIVDVSKGPERIYRLCPVLFWTIASISLRHLSTDILMSLAPLLKTALAEITISPITRYFPNESEEPILNVSSVYSVQALLLYTYWPPLTSSLSADSSWNTVGIAIFQAIRIGLNGPGTTNYHVQQQSQQTEMAKILQEHNKTWISCNIVSQTIATAFGFPAFVSFDSSVVGCIRGVNQVSSLPTCIRQMVEITHFEEQVAKVLNSNTVDAMGLADPTERLPLLKVLGQQLNELEVKLSSEGLDDIRKFQILASRVHLLTYYFLDNARVANFELRRGLVSVFNAACALLSHASSVSNKDSKFFKYIPGIFLLQIWQATCILAKLVHSPLSDVIDVGAGRQLYISAMQLANKASILKHDMAYRSAGIMRNTWQMLKFLKEKSDSTNLDVTVRSRMSASVFFDCLWLLRQQIGLIKIDPRKKESSADLSNNEDEDDEDEYDESTAADERNSTSGPIADPGTVNSEASMRSTTSSQRAKRGRALSNNFDAENSARKLIKTVPLDPLPISLRKEASDTSPRPTISSILQKQSPDSSTSSLSRFQRPQSALSNHPISAASSTSAAHHDSFQDPSPTNIPSLDLSDDWTNDMLWKDVDSVMNDFGFSTDELQRTVQPSNGATSNAEQDYPVYKQGSLFGNYR